MQLLEQKCFVNLCISVVKPSGECMPAYWLIVAYVCHVYINYVCFVLCPPGGYEPHVPAGRQRLQQGDQGQSLVALPSEFSRMTVMCLSEFSRMTDVFE